MAGRRVGEKPSSFSVTCSLLSQYLKEKGGFGDLGLGMAARPHIEIRGDPEPPKTMNLLQGMEDSDGGNHTAAKQESVDDPRKSPTQSVDLFTPGELFAHALHADEKPDLNREPRAAAAQMTIFYGGKVVVFDNFPVDKARELMEVAGRGCPDPAQVFRVEKPSTLPRVAPPRAACRPPMPHNSASAALFASTSETKTAAVAAATASDAVPAVAVQEAKEKETQPASSDLPIARRVSLHRFLEKRKDRIHAKAPYQLNGGPVGVPGPSSTSPAKSEDGPPWLGLAPRSSKPEDLKRWPSPGKAALILLASSPGDRSRMDQYVCQK